MTLSPSSKFEKRSSLLNQLKAVQERQEQLYGQLTALVTEEVAFARYLIDNRQTAGLREVCTQAVVEYRERAAIIIPELTVNHQKISRIFEDLRILH